MIDQKRRSICSGDVVELPIGCYHTAIAESELQMIEVQLGYEISVQDKRKHLISYDEIITIANKETENGY